MTEGSRSRAGSGFRRPKNTRIRIHNTSFLGCFFSEASNITKILFFWKKEDLNKFYDPESRHRLIIGFLILSYPSKINRYFYCIFRGFLHTLKKCCDMFAEANAAHPVGCDSPLQIVMAVWHTSNLKKCAKRQLLSAQGCHT